MTSVTITPMLDEDDNTPVFEVRDENGNATNAVTIEDALEIVKSWTLPVLSLEDMAKNWIIQNGTSGVDGIQQNVEEEFSIKLTDDQWDSFANMVSYAKVTVEFPFGYGVPPVIGG